MSEHGNSSKSSDLKNQNVLEISEIADLGKTIFVLFNKKPVKDKPIENKPNSNSK